MERPDYVGRCPCTFNKPHWMAPYQFHFAATESMDFPIGTGPIQEVAVHCPSSPHPYQHISSTSQFIDLI